MADQHSYKKFEDYQNQMPMQHILVFAKIGFICAQILKSEGLAIVEEMIKCQSSD